MTKQPITDKQKDLVGTIVASFAFGCVGLIVLALIVRLCLIILGVKL